MPRESRLIAYQLFFTATYTTMKPPLSSAPDSFMFSEWLIGTVPFYAASVQAALLLCEFSTRYDFVLATGAYNRRRYTHLRLEVEACLPLHRSPARAKLHIHGQIRRRNVGRRGHWARHPVQEPAWPDTHHSSSYTKHLISE